MQVVQRQKFAPVAIFAFARISNGLIQRVLVGTQTEYVVRGDSLTRNIKQHISKFSIILHLYIRHITILPSHISMMDGINSLQFIEEIFIEILIQLVKRQFRLEYLFGEMLFSRSSCNHVWTFESTTPTATCRLQEVFIALTQGICNLIFLLFAVVQLHDAHGIAKNIMHLLLFLKIFFLTICHKVVDDRSLLLTIAVDTAITLFEGDKTPRYVIVEHCVTEVVQIDTLRT